MIPSASASFPRFQQIVAREINPVLEGYPFIPLATDPASPRGGFTYYNTTTGKVRSYNGVTAAWADHY